LAAGTLVGQPQANPGDLKHAPKIFTETGKIDWTKPAAEVYNLIRGLSPFPAAYTELDGKLLKIYRAEYQSHELAPDAAPGVYDTDGKSYLRFATPDGYIRVTELQLEGKKRMAVGDFLRGYRFA
jgi:methionyl-tRNA formyltransferase